jgi:glycosyltransferase involved in cell wall biosynthesis
MEKKQKNNSSPIIMKAIACLAPYRFLPYHSGGQKLIAMFTEYLGKEKDIQLHVLGSNDNDISLAKNYQLHAILGTSAFQRYANPLLYFKIKNFVKNNNITTLIIEHPYHAWLAWLLKKTTSVKVILHTHNIEHLRFKSIGKWWWQLLRLYEKWFFNFANEIFFISDDDLQLAVSVLNINAAKSVVVPFGVIQNKPPENKQANKEAICKQLNIPNETKLFLFPANFSYKPNKQALDFIIENINPLLLQQNIAYKIVITGKGLPASYNRLQTYSQNNIVYLDFVDDIDLYFSGVDLLLNPVTSGGGVKTKLVDAISFNTTVASTASGAKGVNTIVCWDKLVIVEDNNWTAFANAVIGQSTYTANTPASFYQQYFWGNIVDRIINLL